MPRNPTIGGPPGFPDLDPKLVPVLRAWARAQSTAAVSASSEVLTPDMTMAQFRLLTLLMRRGRMHGRELGAALCVTPSTVVPLIDRLEERGLVERITDTDDRRITWIRMTPAGREEIARFWHPVAVRVAHAVESFSPAERETLEGLLTRIADHLDSHRHRDDPHRHED